MKKRTAQNQIRLWAVLFWLVIWQAGSMVLQTLYPHGHLLLPSPVSALVRLGELALTGVFWKAIGWSTVRIIGGFLISCLTAVLLAIPASRWKWVRELLSPLVAAVKAVPVASFIILALVWLDSRSLSFFIAFLMVFPPVYLNVLEGICQTDRKMIEMAKVFRVPLWRQIRGLYLPQVLPYFRTAVSLALGLCWKAGIAAEVIGLPGGSLGEHLYNAKVYFMTPDLFAWTAVIVTVSVVFEKLFLCIVDALVGKAGAK